MDVERELKKFIINRFLHGDGSILTDEQSLFEAGIIDSLGVLHLVSFLEARFNVKIKDEELVPENFETVHKLNDFLRRKREGRA